MADTKTYVVKSDGWLHGTWRNHGAHVQLTDRQAKDLLRDEKIAAVEPKATTPTRSTGKD